MNQEDIQAWFQQNKSRLTFWTIGLVLLGVIFYFIHPWPPIHAIAMIFYVNPWIIQLFVITGAIYALVSYQWSAGAGITLAGIFLVVGFIVFALAAMWFAPLTISDQVEDRYTETDDIHPIDAEHPRFLPLTVADQYGENSLQEPRHRLTRYDITVGDDGSLSWAAALAPDGIVNSFAIQQKGAVFIDMEQTDRELSVTETNMKRGVGMSLERNYLWALKDDKYFVRHGDPIYVEKNDELHMAVPYTAFELHNSFGLFYRTPTWGGVALIDSDRNVDHMTPEEAQNHEVTQNQRLYPFQLTRIEVNSMRYKHGVMNKLFYHEGELEIAGTGDENNQQPFLVMTEDGMKYFLAVEPAGDASGIFEIWMYDAQTGAIDKYAIGDENDALIGPKKAINFVRQSERTTDWNLFNPSEPIPTSIDGDLYWMVRVVPDDGSGVALISFVNADTSNVVSFVNDEDAVAFMKGEIDVDEVEEEVDGAQGTVTITLTDDEGNVVEEITINDGESITIEVDNQEEEDGSEN